MTVLQNRQYPRVHLHQRVLSSALQEERRKDLRLLSSQTQTFLTLATQVLKLEVHQLQWKARR